MTVTAKKKKNEDKLKNDEFDLGGARPAPDRNTFEIWLYRFPWWALVMALVGIYVAVSISADALYSNIFNQLRAGIEMTLRVSVLSYLAALAIGLVIGIIRANPPRPVQGFAKRILSYIHLVIYNLTTMFVEVFRGTPIIIALLVFAFVIIPAFKDFMELQYGIEIQFRSTSVETAIIALSMTYGAFLSEVFRAGIQSIEKGQIEAARSLGMTYLQTMRLVVLPQAVRRILPPLGNDFIAMIKDSSLVAFLGIRDVTQLGKVVSGSNFRYLETYMVVVVIYLTMTILGSLLVRLVERYLKQNEY